MRIGTNELGKKKQALFTPKAITNSLLRNGSQPPQQAPPRKSDKPSVTVSIDGTFVAKTLFKVGAYLFTSHQQKKKERESTLDERVLRLAKHLDGLLGVPDLVGFQICDKAEGLATLNRLSQRGRCSYLCDYKEDAVYVFPEFIQRVWLCEYCDSNFPIETDQGQTCTCSNCSAPMSKGLL